MAQHSHQVGSPLRDADAGTEPPASTRNRNLSVDTPSIRQAEGRKKRAQAEVVRLLKARAGHAEVAEAEHAVRLAALDVEAAYVIAQEAEAAERARVVKAGTERRRRAARLADEDRKRLGTFVDPSPPASVEVTATSSGNGLAVQCPFCRKAHIHNWVALPETQRAHCGLGTYTVVGWA